MRGNTAPTLGSLFDGAGGFPLAGSLTGFTPVWASEIEPFPIRVTTRRFPNMLHLGDICKMNGGTIPPVDVITFGSPCQDLSVANGNRKGLSGEQSGLFREAIRIIKEMREASNGSKPNFIIWENVIGAFSTNNGEDFRKVIEAIAQVTDGKAIIPRPENNKWPYAGEVVGDNYSIAYRVFDAQFWGVPQRRRRIYLVADFGGQRAGKIQFKRERLFRDITPCGGEGETTAGKIGDRTPTAIRPIIFEPGVVGRLGRRVSEGGISGTIRAHMGDNLPVVLEPIVYGLSAKESNGWKSDNPHSGFYITDKTRTLDTTGCNPTCNQGGNLIVCAAGTSGNNRPYVAIAVDNHPHDSRIKLSGDVAQTLTENMGKGGGNEPMVLCLDRASYNQGKNAQFNIGIKEDLSPTIVAKGPNAVCENMKQVHYRVRRLTPLECCRLQGFPDYWAKNLAAPNPTKTEIDWWSKVFETHRLITNPLKRPKTRRQIYKWLTQPYTDGAEYKMWGNSLAIPCAYTLLAGIAEELTNKSMERRKSP